MEDLWLQDQLKAGKVKVVKVHTQENVSDMGTKPLDAKKIDDFMHGINQERIPRVGAK